MTRDEKTSLITADVLHNEIYNTNVDAIITPSS